jgi:two-component system response regulator AlgR
MKILIVDDEAHARSRLAAMLAELGGPYELCAAVTDGEQALAACAAQAIDVALLDIRMPGIDGLEVARRLAEQPLPPAVIFTTAYDEHAMAAFDSQAVGYLLKPIRREQLRKALTQAVRLTRPQLDVLAREQAESVPQIAATARGAVTLIPLDQVYFLQADSKYVLVRHARGQALVEDSLKSLDEHYPGRFLRVHRNALVAPERVAGMSRASDGRALLEFRGIDDRVEVSRRHLPAVRRWLRGDLS